MADAEVVTTPTGRARPGRVRLLRTAVALMGEQGYDGTSTRDIASAAGVSVAALYYHFPSKLDLLREFLFEAHDIVLARVAREVEAAGGDPVERLDAAVATLIASHVHDEYARLASNVAWREHGRLERPDRDAVAAKRQELVEMVEAVLRDGVTRGAFTTTKPAAVARAVVILCISLSEPFPSADTSMDELIRIHQGFARGLAVAPVPGAARGRRRRSNARPDAGART